MPRCEKCELHKISKVNCLQGSGNREAQILICGEGPGVEEELYGRVFCGPAGRLLDQMLTSAGLSRSEVYVTNAVKCRPAVVGPKQNRPPKKKEIEICKEYLLKEIEEIKPKIIITLGNAALDSLTNKKGISNYRGTIFTWDKDPSIFIAPIYHPAAILRQREYHQITIEDFKRVKEKLEDKKVEKKTQYIVVNTPELLDKYYKRLMEVEEFAFDIETTGFDFQKDNIICISFSWKEQTAICIPLLNQDGTNVWNNEVIRPKLQEIFSNKARKCGHNAWSFDIEFLMTNGFDVQNYYFDTMLAHHLIDENADHDLKYLAWVYTDMGGYDQQKSLLTIGPKRKKSFLEIPPDVLYPYAAADADCTFRLFKKFETMLQEQNLDKVFFKIVMPLSIALRAVELRGVKIDTTVLSNIDIDYAKKIEELKYAIDTEVLMMTNKQVNINSPKQLQVLFFDDLKLDKNLLKDFLTPTGAVSTNEEALEVLAKQHPIAKMISDYRGLTRAKKVIFEGVKAGLDKHDRIHTSYLIHGSATGRLSSRGPNLQNITRDDSIRNIFSVEAGYSMVSFDYSQAELRVLAHLSRDPALIDSFMRKEDIHRRVASEMFGIPFDEVTKEQRVIAKGVVFGLIYGRGAGSLAEEFNISFNKAEDYINAFFLKYPGVARWTEDIKRTAFQAGELVSIFGRKRRFPGIATMDKKERKMVERMARNFPVQSGASDILSIVTGKLYEKLQNKPATLVLTIHDALVYEIQTDRTDAIIRIIEDTMCDSIKGLLVPLEVETTIGTHWGSLKLYEDYKKEKEHCNDGSAT